MNPFKKTVASLGMIGLVSSLVLVTPAYAADTSAPVRINEVESSGGVPGDWIEFFNTADADFDISGFVVKDNKDDNLYVFPASTIVPAQGYLVIDELNGGIGDFDFGLGKDDFVRLFSPDGELVDSQSWEGHATHTYGVDELGQWGETAESTKGAKNIFSSDAPLSGSIVINEVDSQPADWVEFYNAGDLDLDISGYEIRDNSDDHRWQFPAGSVITAGEFLVVSENSAGLINGESGLFREAIGIGSADQIRIYNQSGELIDDSGAWEGHAQINGDAALATLARCPDGEGALQLAHPTPGASNECVLPDVAINEIESNGDATDWVEIINNSNQAVEISGWSLMDNDPVGHASDITPVASGTFLAPGELFVFEENVHFSFGLGKADSATIRDANGLTVAEHSWSDHANGVLARCPDGTGDFVDVAVSSKGLRNSCGNPVRINEVVSDGGDPEDWIELVNPSTAALEVGGIVVKDNDDSHAYVIPNSTVIAPGGYLVIEREELGFGLGGADSVRLFDGELLIDEVSWEQHPLPSLARCADTVGNFAISAAASKGERNECVGEVAVSTWPGSAEVRILDKTATFLSDSSGLAVSETAEGVFVWAVDNGTGNFWKLKAAADGSLTFADGWSEPKRARFQRDAENPRAAGPDAEGITVDGAGWVYLASERDNSAKGVNQNTILRIDPNAAGPDVVASTEWDITALLPQVSANLGIEAIEWISDDVLAGALFDQNSNAPYDPSAYAAHSDGLFFVAVEDAGQIFALALYEDGSAQLVAELSAGLAGVMALDYDSVLGVLWAVCDDGCEGKSAQLRFNGTDSLDVAHFERPAGMPNINNEGFATAPASLSVNGQRPVWWFADGYETGSLRVGFLPGVSSGENPDGSGNPTDPDVPAVTDNTGSDGGDPAVAGGDAAGLPNTGETIAYSLLWLALASIVIGGAVLVMRRKSQIS